MKKIMLLVFLSYSAGRVFAQKTVLNYPFEFEKSFLQKGLYDAYFLDDQEVGNFAFILKDNKKVNYVLVNDRSKVAAQFTTKIEGTVFDHDGHQYLGGTSDKDMYHYIYKVTDKKFMGTNITYMEETVDFDAKTVSNKKVFEIPKDEQLLLSFSDHNRYFTLTANKKTSDLQLYQVSGNGEAITKTVHFTIPPGKSKDKNELTGWLAGMKMIKEGEEPGLDLANHAAKLFAYADRLVITVNDGDNPTQLFTIALPGFAVTEAFVDHSSLEEKGKHEKSYISSYLKDQKLFALVLNKKDILIAVYNEHDGSLIGKMVINEANGLAAMAQSPVADTRMGKKRKEEDVDDIKTVIKAFTRGTEGLTVATNKAGQYVVQVGTYDLIPMSTGGGGSYMGGFEMTQAPRGSTAYANGIQMMTYNPDMYYVPGRSSYMSTSARYYKTIYFKVLLDSSSLKPVRGRVASSIGEQIKDFMDDSDQKAKVAKQFAIGGKQYYGFYDRDQLAYVIQEIMIRK